MLTIGVLNAKGGVGKTTIATTLAVRAAKDFKRVGLVDLDPQQGAARWCQHRGGVDNPHLLKGADSAQDAVDRLVHTGWDIAIFDGAPGSLEATEETIQVVDFVLIPLKASDQDLASTEYVVSACQEFETPYMMVINEAGSGNDKRALEVQKLLSELGQPVAETLLRRRVPYVDAINTGKSAAEVKGGEKASEEIDALYDELMKRINGRKPTRKRRRA